MRSLGKSNVGSTIGPTAGRLPFPTDRFPFQVDRGDTVRDCDRDCLEARGFSGPERRGKPLNVSPGISKFHFFEFCGLREVKRPGRYRGGKASANRRAKRE